MKLVLATKNRGKQLELQALLAPFQVDVHTMPADLSVEEDGDSYLENAVKKASAVARSAGAFSLADDSGIEVDAMDGAPGVHSARFLNGATDEEKCQKILDLLRGRSRRGAKFRIALALADPARIHFAAHAELPGRIADQVRGTSGFGYDPIFIPDGHSRTLAEMNSTEKNALSHRGRAVRALIRFLKYAKVAHA
ncbi:RdgB/HAM1 family non-canonical purine NTP pyrophosphatase [bacterium]|nr:RdgB/HAM1 family non-canonical purine NTP pyrophosphatase [bacterium]